MSWFKHSPPKYPPNHTPVPPPQRTSPATEKSLKAAKKKGPKKK